MSKLVKHRDCLRADVALTLAAVAVLATGDLSAALAGQYRQLYRFDGNNDGAQPINKLTNVNGTLFGISYAGGREIKGRPQGWGTVFAFDPASATETVVHTFWAPRDRKEALPYQTMLYANQLLYGATECARACPEGTDFTLDPSSGDVKVTSKYGLGVYNGAGGMVLWNNQIWGADFGGLEGTIFTLSGNGKRTVVFSFYTGQSGAPAFPEATPVPVGSLLYGNTNLGGSSNNGAIYSFDPTANTLQTLYSFTGGSDGAGPRGDLALVGTTLYGTNASCSSGCSGTVYSYDTSAAKFTTVYSFTGGADGGFPANGVTALNGKLYGTTYFGGKNDAGVLFEIDPASGKYNVVHDFSLDGEPTGFVLPQGLIAVGNTLYGVTYGGGKKSKVGGDGIIFSYTP